MDEVEGRRKAEAKDTLDEGSSQSDTEHPDAGQTSAANEREKQDQIVESVKNCRDLNEHEQNLLQCIVDCG